MNEPLLYKILRPIIKVWFYITFRPTIIGKENIPKKGRVILAGNHTNNLDSLFLMSSTNRCIHFLAKDSLCKGPKKIIFKNMGIVPVNRKIHDKDALHKGKEVLKEEKVIGIFPEGTINRTSDIIMPFKIGAVKMASDTDTCIVPFTITGKYKVFSNKLTLKFLKPYKISNKDLDIENKILMDKIKCSLREE